MSLLTSSTSPGELARRVAALALGLLALVLLWPAVVDAQEPPARDIRTLWSDGDELLLAGDRGAVRIYGRDGKEQASEAVGVELFIAADGTRAVGGVSAVFAAADGRLVRWRPGSVVEDQVPLLEGDELVAVVVDASGTIYAIGRDQALYQSGRRWRIYPYPTRMRPLAAASSPGGQVYIVGRDGLLVRFLDGSWDRPLVPGLTPESIRAPWYDAWYSAVTETLWVRAGRDRLLEFEFGEQRQVTDAQREGFEARPMLRNAGSQADPEGPEQAPAPSKKLSKAPRSGPEQAPSEAGDAASRFATAGDLHLSGTVPVREHPIPAGAPSEDEPPAGSTAITGVSTAAGDRVVTTAGNQVWLWDRSRFVLIGRDIGGVHDIALDESDNAVWIAAHAGLRRMPLRALSETGEDDPLNAEDQKLLERLRRREAWRLRNADAPRFFFMPTIRVDNGVVFPLGAEQVAGYSLEIGAGALLAPLTRDRGPILWVWPEFAYRYEIHPTRGGHLFDLGVGVGFGTHLIAAYYRPRLVLGGIDQGTDDGPAVYGLRHGVALQVLWGVIGVELSQQVLGSNQGPLSDLRIGLSINLAPLIWAGILWATIPTNQ